ncbi:MAG: hypothetical protein NUV46_01005 [Nanoarchaeota archaeon]|nr:hypothetical protein [Nanoarchaeota archaeon]
MDYNSKKGEIKIEKTLNNLDKFVLDFISSLKEYVIVSGYVSILMGRSRATEDVDLLIPKLDKVNFLNLWENLQKNGFWCINTSKYEEAFDMLGEHAIRFAKNKNPIPNIELKFIKNELDRFSYLHKIKVLIGSEIFFISPLELQIAYKLFLGSQKDIEDARHLYNLFKEKINKEELIDSLNKLNVSKKMRFLEKWEK